MLRGTLAAFAVAGMVSCVRESGVPPQEPSKKEAAGRPAAIRRVFPPEGSRQKDRQPEIRVDLSYRNAPGGAVGSIRLFLDGQEVKLGPVVGTMDIPQSGASVGYQPPAPLSPGRHEARVEARSQAGNLDTYSWSFEVE